MPEMQNKSGLTAAEVAERVCRGQVNRAPSMKWRDYGRIVARNLFTWFNAMVTPAAVALLVLKEYQAAIAVSGMAIVNTLIGLVQELRAKHHLDKLALLVEARARVQRDGQVVTIPAGEVVLDDVVLLGSGETVVADGPVLEARFLEIDEALLTGESDPVRRQAGDRLLSGSFCVAGEGAYLAEKVGTEAFAQQTSSEARHYRFVASPLTKIINRIVLMLTYVAVALIALYTVAFFVHGGATDGNLQREKDYVLMVAATITSMVPQGMVLTATISFLLGAVVMSQRGAVVQRLSAVETMAAVDVVCTDKTGTLTTNRLRLDHLEVLDGELGEEAVKTRLRHFISAALDQKNRNVEALKAALGEEATEAIDQIPFKSQNRYSAVRLRCPDELVLVLGAPESLRERTAAWLRDAGRSDGDLAAMVEGLQKRGQRVLLFAQAASFVLGELTTLPDDVPLRPLALVCLSDELRPEAGKVLEALHERGIAFKVLSGDNPATVQGTVSTLKLPIARDPVISGDELARAADAETLIAERSVFGRVAPQQKVQIVQTLQRQGRCVAMIGDGVNDLLPIKRADLGIAMGEGAQATKAVSALVLQTNNFDLLPETLEEGRVILRNLRRSAKLFLVKNVYSFILILAYFVGWFGLPFPYLPQQVTLLNWSVIGVPALVIAFSRERSTAATKPRFLLEVGWFALRTGVIFALAGLVVLGLAGLMHGGDDKAQRTMLLSTLILVGITALWRTLKDGEPETLQGDFRIRMLGLAAIPLYLLAMYWPLAAGFFQLVPMNVVDWLVVAAVAGAAYGATLASDVWTRRRLAT